ncbi:hypothetical protein HPP92_023546 [Vanilla planifolia]|uniref:Uncharacterized protein n=1 Tax=Vanilla planifolia TaxID=51239 RepID=A0A835PRP6_VANPL|nr:hypothetical protein HPP92_023546 [Vanilla planifolia]
MELEALREKIRVLEDSYENLNIEVFNNAAEKAVLATNVEVLTDNVVKLSEKNTLVESSLADANTKLEGLQARLGDLDNYNHSLSVENLSLLIHKEALISQVEGIRNVQANLKARNALLENKLVTLEKEKELSFTQVIELKNDLKIKQSEHESLIDSSKIRLVNLENQIRLLHEDKKFRDDDLEYVQQKCLRYMIEVYVLLTCVNDLKGYLIIERQDHDHHIQSSKNHLATLENKIDLLLEERQLREYEVDEEQKKLMNYMLENFILWTCLSEAKEKNFILLEECYKHLEVSRCSEQVISQLEDSKLLHMEKITLLMEHDAKLKDGMNLLLESLNINSELMGMIGTEVVLQTILCEIAHLLSNVSDFQDENQLLHMELSVYRTLLKQNALENVFIEQVLGRVGDQLLFLQWDQHWLIETCKQLEQEVNDRDYTNEAFKFKLLVLSRHLMDLSEELHALRQEKNAMEEENNVLLREAMTLEHLHLYFRRSTTENMHAVKVLNEGFCSLLKIKKDLNELKIETNMRLKIVDTENKRLKDSFFLLEKLRSQVIVLEFDLFTTTVLCEELILEVETRETLLERKDMEILRSRHKLQCMEEEVTRLCAKLETTNKRVV